MFTNRILAACGRSGFSIFVAIVFAGLACRARAAEMAVDDAWKALPKYEYGQDMAPLLAIDRTVIRAMATPESRSACAARLAAVLESADATPAARQYVCLQLRQIGTPAQVPLLARLLETSETSEMARHALEAIPGEEPLAALRGSLDKLHGPLLVGAINSLGARKDAASVPRLQELADGPDAQVASAALWALGNIGGDRATAFLMARAEKARDPLPQDLAVPLLRCADGLAGAGAEDQARAIYARLSRPGEASAVRRAALDGLLRREGTKAQATVLAWFADPDADRRRLAAGRLAALSDEQLDRLAGELAGLPDAGQLALLEVLAQRKGKSVLPLALSAAKSDKPAVRLAGVRCLGLIGDDSAIPLLVDCLADDCPAGEAARNALCRLPRKQVGEAMLAALKQRPNVREGAIGVLENLRYYEAIDPLIVLAGDEDPAVYGPALDGLRGIADPDPIDVPRLVKLWLAAPPGKRRDEVERTIAIVCDKVPSGSDRARPVLAAMAKLRVAESPEQLPLLGRFGGPEILKRINAAMTGGGAASRQAAVRGLCNWPGAEVADRLWELAVQDENPEFRPWALRAYVRVVTLKSSRPEAETLAMLRKAMARCESPEDRQYVLTRTSTVRTIEAVEWLAGYLDDPALGQAACLAIVELAHHRFLRQPNMARFGPLLEKIGRISKDPAVAERARKYRLGL